MRLIRPKLVLLVLFILAFPGRHSAQETLVVNPSEDRAPSWSPDGEWIAFQSDRNGNQDIYIVSKDGSTLKRITFSSAQDRGPSWYPDSKHILFTSDRTGTYEMFSVNILNPEAVLIRVAVRGDIMTPRCSPNGGHIAFSAKADSVADWDLFVVNSDGTDLRRLTVDSTRSLYPDWSPDGARLAFFSRRNTRNTVDEVYTLDIISGDIARITTWPTHNFCPAYAPDGKSLVCATSVVGSRPELYLIDIETRQLQRITENTYGDTEPDWSPDGRTIVYACYLQDNYDICIVEVD